MTIRAGIMGATGYTGMELLRILLRHPAVEVVAVTSEKQAGKTLAQAFPYLQGTTSLVLEAVSEASIPKRCDVLFSCLPHTSAMNRVPGWLKKGIKVIDLSADFRLDSADVYQEWYGAKQTAPDLLSEKVYGLTELNREKIKKASLVANPGCYPTSAILGLAPLLKSKLIDTATIIIDSKSGTSGAGRSAAVETLFCEVNESIHAYKIGTHRHTPEIEQEISKVAGEKIIVSFTPHLIPMDRGILSTAYAKAASKSNTKSVLKTFSEFYAKEPFVTVLPEGVLPRTKDVRGSNHCAIGAVFDPRTQRIVVTSAIDNLMKGAASQAVQNMNLMFGLDEKSGLNSLAWLP